jgi:hypothetical protein
VIFDISTRTRRTVAGLLALGLIGAGVGAAVGGATGSPSTSTPTVAPSTAGLTTPPLPASHAP